MTSSLTRRCALLHTPLMQSHILILPFLSFNLPQWSGADYMDNLMKTVTGGVSSTAAMGKGVTEDQFKSKL